MPEKKWLKHYPPGVPHDVCANRFSSLAEMFDWACGHYPDNVALIFLGSQMTYRELGVYAQRLCASFQHELGLKKGDRIALMLPNSFQYPVALYAAFKAGLVVVNCNPLYTVREVKHILSDSGAKAIIVVENFADVVVKAMADTQTKHLVVTKIGDMLGSLKGGIVNTVLKYIKKEIPAWDKSGACYFSALLAKGRKHNIKAVNIHRDDLAILQYTGGTTGFPKAAMLSNHCLLSNIAQGMSWVSSGLENGHETIVTALPLYHIFALTVCLFCYVSMGSKCLLIPNPRDRKSFIKTLKKYPATVFVGLNTLFQALLMEPSFAEMDFSQYKYTLSGGMALQKSVADRWMQVTHHPIIEGYGLTETSPLVCINPINTKVYRPTVGMPLPSTDISIRDENNNEVPEGEMGEVCIHGPQVMQGYWQKPEETANVIDADGWFHTGDIGRFDDQGYVYLVDRKKDMIIISGFNVYPNEVEDVLTTHPDILEAAVVGVPSERTGEAVKAFLVVSRKMTKDHVILFCKERLAAYKIPKQIEFRDELPKSNVGKVLRRALRDESVTPVS